MSRTTSLAVQKILLDEYDNVSDLSPFIESASSVADYVSAYASRNGVSVTSTTLELIERWLAAHFYKVPDRPSQETRKGRSEDKFQGKTGMNLASTYWGQTALTLDYTGALNALNSGKGRASVKWLGKTETEKIEYQDRN